MRAGGLPQRRTIIHERPLPGLGIPSKSGPTTEPAGRAEGGGI